ncbi:hypothetical protein D3C72_2534170 [compost metagenome]
MTSARSSHMAWFLSACEPVLTGTMLASEPGERTLAALRMAVKPISETPPGWMATRICVPLAAAVRMSSIL